MAKLSAQKARSFGLSEYPFYHVAMHIRQPELPALETVCKSGVIYAAKMQNSCLHIVHVDWIFCDVPPVVVGSTVHATIPYPTACHPPTKSSPEVIATIRLYRISLTEWRSAKLGSPDDKCILEQASLF